MNSFTIKTKLYLLTVSICVVLIGIGVGSTYSLSNVNDKSTEISDIWMQRVSLSGNINTLTSDYRLAQYNHIVAQSPEKMAEMDNLLADLSKKIDEKFMECTNLSVDPAEKEEIKRINQEWDEYEKAAAPMIALSRQFKVKEASEIIVGDARKRYDKVSADIMKFQEFNLAGGNKASKQGDEIYSSVSKILNGTIIFSIVILVLTMVLFTKWLINRFNVLSDRLGKIAEGDLREKIRITVNDELGGVADSVNKMIEKLLELIGQIQHSAQQVAASSEELTASADQSAQVTQQVAQSITEVSELSMKQVEAVNEATSIMQGLSANVEVSVKSIDKMENRSKEAVATAQEGNQIIAGAVNQMNNIESTVNESAEVVMKLGQRSKEIGQIVDTISGIAGQTNLLALNAAIEAARAGEQGKGFAVVAEEVRKLAEQSQEAAKQIGELISAIQGDTDNAVVAMNSGTEEVRSGAEVVNKAGDAFNRIFGIIDDVNQQSVAVAKVMNDVSDGIQAVAISAQAVNSSSHDVSGEAQSVSAATEEQAASMEQIASGSRSLANLAQELQVATVKFRV